MCAHFNTTGVTRGASLWVTQTDAGITRIPANDRNGLGIVLSTEKPPLGEAADVLS
jgi:hypothetical protein